MAGKKHFAGIDFRNSKIAINGNTTSSRYLGTDANGDLEWKVASSSNSPTGMAITRRGTASASSGVIEVTGGISSSFPAYKIIGTGIYASSNEWASGAGGDPQFLKVTLGTSSAYLTASDYKWHMMMQYPNYNDTDTGDDSTSNFQYTDWAADGVDDVGDPYLRSFRNHKFDYTNTNPRWNTFWRIGNLYNDEYQAMNFEMNLYGLQSLGEATFADSRASCNFTCKSTNRDAWFESGLHPGTPNNTSVTTPMFSEVTSSGMFSVDDSADIDITRLKFEAGSGTLSGGTISVYDISHTN